MNTGDESPKGSPREPGTNRLAATIAIWLVTAGLGGLVWLGTQHPFLGLPVTHPINLTLFGFCLAIGLGYTVVIWLPRRTK